jgi:hypothetical protein
MTCTAQYNIYGSKTYNKINVEMIKHKTASWILG